MVFLLVVLKKNYTNSVDIWGHHVFKLFLSLYDFFQTPLQWWFFFNWWFRKRVYESKLGNEYCENLWTSWLKFWLGVGESPLTLWRVEVILKIMVIWLGAWVILIRIIPTRRIWLVHVIHCRVRVIRVKWGRGEYGFILWVKKLLLSKSISQFTKKKTNKQRKRKRKQAYARVDL